MQVDVLWTARYDYPAGWTLRQHCHDHFQMILVLAGTGSFQLGAQRFDLGGGVFLLLKPGVVHGLSATSEVRTVDVKFHVQRARLRRLLLAAPDWIVCEPSLFQPLFEHIRREGEEKGLFYRSMCSLFLTQLLLSYLRQARRPQSLLNVEASSATSADPLVHEANQIIRGRLAEPLSVLDVARALGCGERCLRTRLQAALGISPLQQIQRLRIEKAKQLIQDSDCELKEVAAQAGFRTIQHFTRVFSRFEGMPPGAWRSRFRDGIRKDVCINPSFSNPNWTIRAHA
jgi:AraC-like DNA-binding protein